MPAPIIQKTGSVSGPSIADKGSNDLVPGETVDLANLEPAHAIATHFWEFVDVPIGTNPTLLDHTTPTPSFVVDPDAKLAGSYEVKCTVDGVEFSTEIYGKPLTNSGGRIPAYREQLQYDEDDNPKGWHEAETIFKRSVDELLGNTQASITSNLADFTIPQGNSSSEVKLGGVVYPGSAIAVAGQLDEAVTSGSIAINLKVNGITKFTATLSTSNPSFSAQLENPGDFPILLADEITVEAVGTSYVNGGAIPSGLVVTAILSSNLDNAPLSIPDAGSVTKGVTRLSTAPILPTTPIAVGDNDPRLPSQGENDALQGTSGVPAAGNRFVTNADPRNSDSRPPTGHDIAGALHNSSTLAQLNSKVSDATLDDASSTRPPSAHTHAHADTTGQGVNDHHNQVHDLAGADHNSATLAQLNAKISDATLDDSASARTPTSHNLAGSEHAAATLANLSSKVSDATLAATDVEQSFSKSQRSGVATLTDAATVLIDASDRNIYKLTATVGIGATRELDNPTNLAEGMTWQVWFFQDGTAGGRALTFDTFYDWGEEGVPDFTGQGTNVKNIITCVALSSTQIAATALKGFA